MPQEKILPQLLDSPLLWSGKKTKLLSQLLPLFPLRANAFIDVFGGSGSVFINTPYLEEYYTKHHFNDLYSGVVIEALQYYSYEHIIMMCKKRIEEFDLSKTNKKGYYDFKTYILDKKYEDRLEKGLDLFILSLFAFNGTLEFNQSGEVTSSFGQRNRFNTMQKTLLAFKKRLDKIPNVEISARGYQYILDEYIELAAQTNYADDYFLYCDVPYSITRTNGYKSDYTDEEMIKLLDEANEYGLKWGMSNVLHHKGKENKLLIEWSKKYHVHHLNTDYNNVNNAIQRRGDTESDEVYICNYEK